MAWPRHFIWHPISLGIAHRTTLGAQNCRFWAVFPNFERHLVVKISESGKSEMAWPRRFIWHPISLGIAHRTTLVAQNCRFWAVFPNFERYLVVKISESGKSEMACPRRLIWHPISLGIAPRTTLRAQNCRFWAVFPNFERHLVVKISESGKSEMTWPRRLMWHPISLCRAYLMLDHLTGQAGLTTSQATGTGLKQLVRQG